MIHSITVVNKKFTNEGQYIGRPSPLGNPFSSKKSDLAIRVRSVEESIALYEQWIYEQIENENLDVINEINRLYKIALEKPLNLVCWCKPAPCHGEIIKEILLELHRTIR